MKKPCCRCRRKTADAIGGTFASAAQRVQRPMIIITPPTRCATIRYHARAVPNAEGYPIRVM
jgi:hypothetical protein